MKQFRILQLSLAALLAMTLAAVTGCQKSAAGSASAATTNAAPASAPWEPTEAQPKLPTVKLYVGAEQMDAELCATPREVQTGMMFRKTMGTNDGMLFTIFSPQQASFWMKNCYVPLSVAYINPDGVIEEIHPLQPMETNPVVSAVTDVEFALETPQGWFDRHHVTTGMVVRTERGSLQQTFSGQR